MSGPAFHYHRAADLQDAIANGATPGTAFLAGGMALALDKSNASPGSYSDRRQPTYPPNGRHSCLPARHVRNFSGVVRSELPTRSA